MKMSTIQPSFIENLNNNQERAQNPGSKTEDHDTNNSRSILNHGTGATPLNKIEGVSEVRV